MATEELATGPGHLPPRLAGSPFSRLQAMVARNHGTLRGLVRATLAQAEFATGRIDPFVQLSPARVERLVFVCLGNINRSAFAASVAQAFGANACSIGLSTTTGAAAYVKAVDTAREFDIDLSGHLATAARDYAFQAGDLLLTMEIRHARRLVGLGMPEDAVALLGHWGAPHRIHLHDPHQLSDAYFRTCFTLIESAVRNLVITLRDSGSPSVTR